MHKWVVLLAYLLIGILSIAYKDSLLAWLSSGEAEQIPLMLAMATFVALFPVIPYGVVGGVMGTKFGSLVGALINVTGSTIAAVIMFLLVRYSFAEKGRRYLSRIRQMEQFTLMVEGHPFFAVLFGRLIPILPAAAINIFAAISRMGFIVFLLATVVGKIPVMLVMAIVGEQLFSARQNLPLVLSIYALFLGAVYAIYRWWTKGLEKKPE